jgi:hypothetical protein
MRVSPVLSGIGDIMENTQDAENLKRLATAIVESLKYLDSELLAYQMTLNALYELRPEEAKFFEASLALAKLSDRYQTTLRKRYDSILEPFLGKVSYVQTVTEACEEWLRVQKEKNPVN